MRIALVTGANRGIGLEVCRQLARRGHIVIASARDVAKAEAAIASLEKAEGTIHAIALDVTDRASIAAARTDIEQRFGRVDILVNNAAVLLAEHQTILETRLEELRTTFDVNLSGAVAVSQAFVPGMVARGFGRVVNVSSRAGQLSTMGDYAPAYSISKTALNAFTRQLAIETSGSGVLVNSACPGWVRTGMGGPHAPRSVDQGADTIVWLATLPDDGPTGEFFSDRHRIDW